MNLTPWRLGSTALLASVREALEVSGLPGRRLCLEIVERAPILSHPP